MLTFSHRDLFLHFSLNHDSMRELCHADEDYAFETTTESLMSILIQIQNTSIETMNLVMTIATFDVLAVNTVFRHSKF